MSFSVRPKSYGTIGDGFTSKLVRSITEGFPKNNWGDLETDENRGKHSLQSMYQRLVGFFEKPGKPAETGDFAQHVDERK